MKIRKFKSIKSLNEILKIAFTNGDSHKIMICGEKSKRWLKDEGLNSLEYNEDTFIYKTPWGSFKLINNCFFDEEKDNSLLIIRGQDSDLTLFMFNVKSNEYIWLQGVQDLDLKEQK